MLIFYFSYAGMISVQLSEVLKDHLRPESDVERQITITSLVLLLAYRCYSRYLATDESTEWVAEFIKGILTTSLVLSGLYFAFQPYIVTAPRLEAFNRSLLSYLTLAICVSVDFALWFSQRNKARRAQADA